MKDKKKLFLLTIMCFYSITDCFQPYKKPSKPSQSASSATASAAVDVKALKEKESAEQRVSEGTLDDNALETEADNEVTKITEKFQKAANSSLTNPKMLPPSDTKTLSESKNKPNLGTSIDSLLGLYGFPMELQCIVLDYLDSFECVQTLTNYDYDNNMKDYPVDSLCRSHDGSLISGSGGSGAGKIKIWDLDTGTYVQATDRHCGPVTSLRLLDDGTLISASNDSTIRVQGKNRSSVLIYSERTSGFHALCLLSNEILVSGGGSGRIKIRNLNTGQIIQEMIPPTIWDIHAICSLCRLGIRKFASSSHDKELKIWQYNPNSNSYECIKTITDSTPALSLCLLANNRLASGSVDGKITIRDLDTYKLIQILEGHTGCVSALCSLPYNKLASGSHDGTIKIWDLNSAQCIQTINAHKDRVTALLLLSDEKFASASWDKTIKIFGHELNQIDKKTKGNSK